MPPHSARGPVPFDPEAFLPSVASHRSELREEQGWCLEPGGLRGEALTDSSCLPRGLMSHCIAILKVILLDFP